MEAQYAGFWRRFAAVLIDGLVLGVVNAVLSFVILLGLGNSSSGIAVSYVLGFGGAIAYYCFYQARVGQTLGKKALGVKVVDANGQTPTVMTFFLREIVGKAISGIILGIGYLWMLWDGKKQCVHDKIAGTYVVKV